MYVYPLILNIIRTYSGSVTNSQLPFSWLGSLENTDVLLHLTDIYSPLSLIDKHALAE